MTLRTYLRLLRPVPNLTWGIVMGLSWSRFALLGEHADTTVANWVGLAAVLPFCWGMALATAAHAGMHRPFFPLLPDGFAQIRRQTITTLIVSIAFGLVALRWVGRAPTPANLGLVSAMMAWPLCNRHTPRWQACVFVPLVLVAVVPARMEHLLLRFPWVTGGVGAAVAATCVAYGFRRADLRARAWIPFNSIGWSFSILGNSAAAQRYLQESILHRAKQRTAREIAVPMPPFTGTTLSWLRVLWFSTGRHPFPRQQVVVAIIFTVEAALLPLFLLPFTHGHYWEALLDLGRVAPRISHSGNGLSNLCIFGLGMGMVYMALTGTPPRMIYPTSRASLGRLIFSIAAIQILVGLAALTVGAASLCLLAQAVTGEWLPSGGLPPVGFFALAILPVLPVLALSRTSGSALVRLASFVVMGLAGFVSDAARPLCIWALHSGVGVAIHLGLTLAAFVGMYLRYRRYYARCDLLKDLQFGAWVGSSALCAR